MSVLRTISAAACLALLTASSARAADLARVFEAAAAKTRAGLASSDLAAVNAEAADAARIIVATLKQVK